MLKLNVDFRRVQEAMISANFLDDSSCHVEHKHHFGLQLF